MKVDVMNLSRLYRGIYKTIVCKIQPLRYMKKVGINMASNNVHIYGHVDWGTEPWIISLGDNVHITDGVKFITHDGGTLLFRDRVPDLDITKPIIIGNDVYIGNNVILLPGITIGDKVVIGAGSIVTRNIPSNSVAVGTPARVIKSTDEYFEKICKESTHLGNLVGEKKDRALMKKYNYNGSSKGIYF